MNIAKEKVFAVIMAGGKGERLWPLSTDERPKPLISLNGQQTLLEDTVQRLFPLRNAENVFVITDEVSAIQARESSADYNRMVNRNPHPSIFPKFMTEDP